MTVTQAFQLLAQGQPPNNMWGCYNNGSKIFKADKRIVISHSLYGIICKYSLEGLMLKLKLQYSGHVMGRTGSLEKILMLGKIESRRRRGRQRIRWLDCQFVFVKVTQSCLTLCKSCGLQNPWNSPGQNTGVDSCFLLQGIFPIQRSNPGLPHCRQILYQLSHKGSS